MIYKLIQVANNSFLDLYMKYCTHLNIIYDDRLYSAEMEKNERKKMFLSSFFCLFPSKTYFIVTQSAI